MSRNTNETPTLEEFNAEYNKKLAVPTFNKKEIIEIVKEGIENGLIPLVKEVVIGVKYADIDVPTGEVTNPELRQQFLDLLKNVGKVISAKALTPTFTYDEIEAYWQFEGIQHDTCDNSLNIQVAFPFVRIGTESNSLVAGYDKEHDKVIIAPHINGGQESDAWGAALFTYLAAHPEEEIKIIYYINA